MSKAPLSAMGDLRPVVTNVESSLTKTYDVVTVPSQYEPKYQWDRKPNTDFELWLASRCGTISYIPADFLCVFNHAGSNKAKTLVESIDPVTGKPYMPLKNIHNAKPSSYTISDLHASLSIVSGGRTTFSILPGKEGHARYDVAGPRCGDAEVAIWLLVLAARQYAKDTGKAVSVRDIVCAATANQDTSRRLVAWVALVCLSDLKISSHITDANGKPTEQVTGARLFRFVSATTGSVVDFKSATNPHGRDFLDALDDIRLDFSASFTDFIYTNHTKTHKKVGEICPYPNFQGLVPGYYDDLKVMRAMALLQSYKSMNTTDLSRDFNLRTFLSVIGRNNWNNARSCTDRRDEFFEKISSYGVTIEAKWARNTISLAMTPQFAQALNTKQRYDNTAAYDYSPAVESNPIEENTPTAEPTAVIPAVIPDAEPQTVPEKIAVILPEYTQLKVSQAEKDVLFDMVGRENLTWNSKTNEWTLRKDLADKFEFPAHWYLTLAYYEKKAAADARAYEERRAEKLAKKAQESTETSDIKEEPKVRDEYPLLVLVASELKLNGQPAGVVEEIMKKISYEVQGDIFVGNMRPSAWRRNTMTTFTSIFDRIARDVFGKSWTWQTAK